MILPDLSHIIEDVGPSSEYSWFDDRGLHFRYRGAGIEPSVGGVAGAAFGMGILMPALARTRQIAFRMVSGTNLAGMGKAIFVYADDHDDEFPPNLNVLLEEGLITSKALESRRRPEGYDGPNFIYVPGQNMSMYPGNIVAYENPEFGSDGVNVLFLDTHAEWMKPDDFLRELKETYERLGREMPEIKFKR
jgi:prepilin-type processing-associated H-X9-DG protein